jgi:hypothetical protein
MRNLRDDAFIWIQVLLIIVLWIFSMILFASGLTIGWDSVRVIPEVVTGYTLSSSPLRSGRDGGMSLLGG